MSEPKEGIDEYIVSFGIWYKKEDYEKWKNRPLLNKVLEFFQLDFLLKERL